MMEQLEGLLQKKEGVRSSWIRCMGSINDDGDFEYEKLDGDFETSLASAVVITLPAVARSSARPGASPVEFEIETEDRTLVFRAEARSKELTAEIMVRLRWRLSELP